MRYRYEGIYGKRADSWYYQITDSLNDDREVAVCMWEDDAEAVCHAMNVTWP